MNILRYKGFLGSIEVNPEEKFLYGKLLHIDDLVTYEGETVAEIEAEFKNSVVDYIKTCNELGKEPQKPFKGSLNVRIGHELHKEAAAHAASCNKSLNEYIKLAIKNQLHLESRAA